MNLVLCYRCGGHVKDGEGRCITCGQRFDPGLKAGPAAGFGAGIKRPRHAVEGAPVQLGELIAGRYQVKDHAGAGPLGWMFRAVEVANDGDVALKILSPRFLQMPEERRVFVEELDKARRLAHPNIARIYQAGDDNGRPFIAAQLLEGLTLRRIMDLRRQKGQRFTLAEVEPIVAQIAAALDAASGSFAHGNLKPDNVIVLPDLLKLTDFGLAVSLPRAPFMAAQKAAGVHRYLAPEFLLGEPLDARTDVFSLGVMLGEMLSGTQYEPQMSILEKNPALPEPVEALFRRAVSPRPAARFASAGEMAAELSDVVAAAPRQPAPVRAPGPEDAGDVVIVDAQTDPRVRIARALARSSELLSTPQPPIDDSNPPPVATIAEPPKTVPDPPKAEVPVEPLPLKQPAPLEPAALAALSSLPLPVAPFTPPPPYVPPAPIAFTPAPPVHVPISHAPAAHAPVVRAPEPAPMPLAAAPAEVPIAPVADEPPTEEMDRAATEEMSPTEVADTPEISEADTAIRPAPAEPPRPRRGIGKRGKDKKGRRRSSPPGMGAGTELADPAWTKSTPPPTEGALAIGPTTPALEPIQPDVPRIETPAPVKVISMPVLAPVASKPAVSFGALEEKKPSRAPLYVLGALAAIVVIAFGVSTLSSKGEAPAETAAAASAEPPKSEAPQVAPKEQPRAEVAKAEPAKPAEPDPNAVVPSRRDSAPAKKPSMRDKIAAVKASVEKALKDRKRKREEALAVANAKRAADARAEATATFPAQTISAPAPEKAPAPAPAPAVAPPPVAVASLAPKAPPVQPSQPTGAISGIGGDDMMVSKDRAPKYATAQAAAGFAAATVKEFNCPPGMQKVPGGMTSVGSDASDDLRNFGDRSLTRVELKSYCIDQYEFPNQPGVLPKVAAPFTEAEALCRNAGKRLCSEDEWESACRGPQNLRFPYGTRYDADACNTTDAKDNPRKTGVAGSFSRCKSGYNVWDLSGNAAEWTTSSFDGSGDKTVKGGHAARPGFDDRCASRRKLNPGARAVSVGFRCCADAR